MFRYEVIGLFPLYCSVHLIMACWPIHNILSGVAAFCYYSKLITNEICSLLNLLSLNWVTLELNLHSTDYLRPSSWFCFFYGWTVQWVGTFTAVPVTVSVWLFLGHWVALCAICCCSHSTPPCGSTEAITRSRSPGWHVADPNGFVQIIASNRISWTTKTTIVMIVYRNYQLHMQNTRPIKKKTFVCEYLQLSELSAHYYGILIVFCEILSDLDKKKQTENCLITNVHFIH